MKGSRIFWTESVLGGLSALFCVLTLVWKDWIEIVFRFDPDHHSGSLEWAIAAAALAVTVIFAVLARMEWRRTALA